MQFLAVFFYVGLVPSLFAIPFLRVLLQPEAYQRAIAVQQPDRQMVELLVDYTTRRESGIEDQAQRGLIQMGRENLRTQYEQILPAGWAESQMNSVVDRLLDFLNLRTDNLSLTVDMTPFKEALTAHSQEMANAMVASWPTCTAQDLMTMGELALSGELTGIPYCQPPALFQPVIVQVARVIINLTADQLPGQIDLASWFGWQGTPAWWDGYRVFHLFLILIPLFTVFVLILMLLLSIQNVRTGFSLIGRTMVTAGFTAAIFLLLGLVLFQPMMQFLFAGPFRLLPTGFSAFLIDITRLVAARYALSVGVLTLGIIVWGFGLIWLPVLFKAE